MQWLPGSLFPAFNCCSLSAAVSEAYWAVRFSLLLKFTLSVFKLAIGHLEAGVELESNTCTCHSIKQGSQPMSLSKDGYWITIAK